MWIRYQFFSKQIRSVALAAAALLFSGGVALANVPFTYDAEDFQAWLAKTKKDAVAKGISEATVSKALEDIAPIERIVQLDRKQPEKKLTHQEYLDKVISQRRIEKGRKLYKQNRTLLNEVAAEYNVQPRFIVALWGIETDYGGYTGSFYVPEALATLAFEGRRATFFTAELMHALKILDQGHISKERMLGSWAGAMGQTQFMPSSFMAFAQDYDKDGLKDIWTTKEDIFASIANYLSKSGWDGKKTWGREVKLPKGFDHAQVSKTNRKKLTEWQELGVRKKDGSELPNANLEAYIVTPNDEKGKAYIVYSNFDVVLKWNRSDYFATAVGTLSDAIHY